MQLSVKRDSNIYLLQYNFKEKLYLPDWLMFEEFPLHDQIVQMIDPKTKDLFNPWA